MVGSRGHVIRVLMGLMLMASSLLAIGEPAHAATAKGGVSMWSACENQYGKGWESYIKDWNAYGWRCGFRPYPNVLEKADRSINVNKQCAKQYGAGAWGEPTNKKDPYSWVCYK
jgi:hypothetical protein